MQPASADKVPAGTAAQPCPCGVTPSGHRHRMRITPSPGLLAHLCQQINAISADAGCSCFVSYPICWRQVHVI